MVQPYDTQLPRTAAAVSDASARLDLPEGLPTAREASSLDLLTPVHLVIILVIALLLFGPKRLPEIGAGIGKTIKEFRKSMNEVQQDLAVEAKQEPHTEQKV